MSNTIGQLELLNQFYRNIFDTRPKQKEEITRADGEGFYPKESRGWEQGITAKDLFDNPTEEDEKIFHENWVSEIDPHVENSDKFIKHLIKRGFTEEKAQLIITFAYDNVERQKSWAGRNETHGKVASNCVNGVIALGIAERLIDSDSVPKIIRTSVSVLYGLLRGKREYEQNTMYRASDDDAAMNIYQANVYGNKIAGGVGNFATFVGKYINSWAHSAIGFLPENIKLATRHVLISIVPFWFRVRQPAEINQSFFTDLINLLIHKIPSLFGIKKSIEVIKDIEKRGTVSSSYFLERHYKNAGITEEKDKTILKLITKTFKLAKGCFSGDIKTQKDSSAKLGKTIAPTLGLYGSVAMGISIFLGPLFRILGIENRLFNFFASTPVTSQQFIYFPKLIMPFLTKAKELENCLSDEKTREKYTEGQIKELKDLSCKFRNLFYLGCITSLSNLLNTALKLKNFENPILRKGVDIIDEIATDLINKFFSQRRHVLGLGFRLTNTEFYTPVVEEETKQTSKDVETPKEVESKY